MPIRDLIAQLPATWYFAVGAALALGVIPLARHLLGSERLLDVPAGPLQVHSRPVPRLGGVGIFSALVAILPLLAFAHEETSLPAGIGLAAAVFALGLADDRFRLPALPRLAMQIAVGAGAGWLGFRPAELPPALGVPVAAVAVAACANGLNWLDGVDGLAGGVAAVAAAALALAFHATGDPAWRDLSATLCGALLSFLAYNLSSGDRKVFLGDCGSMSCGALLGLAALQLGNELPASGLPVAPWIILAVPLLELGITVARRVFGRQPLFRGDRCHTYDRLLRAGVGLRQVLVLHWVAALAAGIVALGFLEA